VSEAQSLGSVHHAAPAVNRTRGRRWLFVLPVIAFVALALALAYGLTRNPRDLPSALLDRPVPEFELPPIEGYGKAGFSSADLQDGTAVVNVFASWCVPCRAEHPLIKRLAEHVPVYGINLKDRPQDVSAWLGELGDPFHRIGADRNGHVAIEWGVYGIPETFIVHDGRVVHKHVGPLSRKDLEETLLPLTQELHEP
jgi:cytochrome c biogenesis protein CcmG, thiol:disulfide interchange protein DsbE